METTSGVKVAEEPKKTVKRDALKSIEQKIQQIWENERVFEVTLQPYKKFLMILFYMKNSQSLWVL